MFLSPIKLSILWLSIPVQEGLVTIEFTTCDGENFNIFLWPIDGCNDGVRF